MDGEEQGACCRDLLHVVTASVGACGPALKWAGRASRPSQDGNVMVRVRNAVHIVLSALEGIGVARYMVCPVVVLKEVLESSRL